MTDHTQRFTNRVDHYAKHRPSCPPAVLDLLEAECGLTSACVVADVGSGTAIEFLLKRSGRLLQNPTAQRFAIRYRLPSPTRRQTKLKFSRGSVEMSKHRSYGVRYKP